MGASIALRKNITSLTGLRFLAALSVAVAHGAAVTLRLEGSPYMLKEWLESTAGFGMTLFFVLSGFVIHFNYRDLIVDRGFSGVAQFLWARFARLYPLFFLILMIDILLGSSLYSALAGNPADFAAVLRALPYFLLLVQSWVYSVIEQNALIYQIGRNVPLTWSISTEWFFYLAYPGVLYFILRIRRPATILTAALVWSAAWILLVSMLFDRSPEMTAWAVARFGEVADTTKSIQDSFFRWLLYFSPYLRIGEFVLGCLTAQLFLSLQDREIGSAEAKLAAVIGWIAVVTIPLFLYLEYAPGSDNFLVKLSFNYGLAPSIAILIFCSARYDSCLSRFLSTRSMVMAGEASYSIYLIHMLIYFNFVGLTPPLPATGLITAVMIIRLVFLLVLIILISLGLHAYFEAPARDWLRAFWTRDRRRSGVFWRPMPTIAALTPVLLALVTVGIYQAVAGTFRSEVEIKHGVIIRAASYGENCGAKHGNVTLPLKRACDGRDNCRYVVDYNVLGDTAGGCGKGFSADYVCALDATARRVEIPGEAGFGSVAVMDCPP